MEFSGCTVIDAMVWVYMEPEFIMAVAYRNVSPLCRKVSKLDCTKVLPLLPVPMASGVAIHLLTRWIVAPRYAGMMLEMDFLLVLGVCPSPYHGGATTSQLMANFAMAPGSWSSVTAIKTVCLCCSGLLRYGCIKACGIASKCSQTIGNVFAMAKWWLAVLQLAVQKSCSQLVMGAH